MLSYTIGGYTKVIKFDDVSEKIQKRYSVESTQGNNLSCGGNIDFLEIKPGEKILDLGCGRGRETFQAAELVGTIGSAYGLDLTQAMVDVANKYASENGVKNTFFIKGSIEALPYDDDTFDAIISSCVINHARSKEAVYREIYRVLKLGGRFVISDAVTKKPLPDEVKNDPEAWAQCFGGAVTEEEYMTSIVKAGFKDIEILNRREYLKNGYDFISLTILGYK